MNGKGPVHQRGNLTTISKGETCLLLSETGQPAYVCEGLGQSHGLTTSKGTPRSGLRTKMPTAREGCERKRIGTQQSATTDSSQAYCVSEAAKKTSQSSGGNQIKQHPCMPNSPVLPTARLNAEEKPPSGGLVHLDRR